MTESQPDYTRKWYVLAAVAMGIFLSTIDGSIVNIALPTLVNELHAPLSIIQWVVLAYLLTITVLMLGFGRLGDILGKKKLYLGGCTLFTLGSVACGLSTTVYMLIGFRIVQAVGAAMIMALGTAITTEAFPPSERGKALGINGLIVSLGIIAGPTLGGLILSTLTWHWIFFVNIPVGITGIILVTLFVPAHRPEKGQRFDLAGAALMLISLASLLFALTIGELEGFQNPIVWALGVVFIVFLAIFIRVENRVREPMIDLGMFRNSLFDTNLIMGFLAFVASSGMTFLMPFYLQDMRNFSPGQAGLMLSVVPLALGISAPLSGVFSDRYGTRRPTVIGLFIALTGYISITTLTLHTSVIGYVLRFFPIGFGIGVFQSPNNSAVMGSVPRERLGIASGLLSITRTLGQTTGTAVLNAIFTTQTALLAGASTGSPTTAPAAVQIQALTITNSVIACVITVAFLISILGLVKARKAELE
jgi:EmrB/QacA subfamily drug resistance transporter